MSEEEKDAIQQLESWREYIIKNIEKVNKASDIEFYLRTALNLIQKQQEKNTSLKAELEKKDNQIKQLIIQSTNLDKQAQQYFETTIRQAEKFDKEVQKKDQIIDYIIDWIRERSICAVDSSEELKQYFERKVEDK